MAASTEPRSGLKWGWALGENNWKTEMDANLLSIGRFAYHLSVKDRDLTAPPGSPVSGDSYIIGASPTGVWAGKAGQVAVWDGAAWTYGTPRTGWRVWIEDEAVTAVYTAGAWAVQAAGAGGGSVTQAIVIACSDETTALTAGTSKVTFRMPYNMTLSGVRASLTTAQTSGSILTVDINEGGTSILSTKLTIDNTEKTSTTAVTAPVISDTALANDAEITIDIDQIGDGTAKGLKVVLLGVAS